MRRTVPAYAAAEGRPIADLNMTPLIDVLLVLIVMFILLVPTLTNEVPIGLPAHVPDGAEATTTHRLAVARNGAMTLDGAAASDAALATRLGAIAREHDAMLVMRVDPDARYERGLQVLAVVKRAGVTRLGFEGLSEAGL